MLFRSSYSDSDNIFDALSRCRHSNNIESTKRVGVSRIYEIYDIASS